MPLNPVFASYILLMLRKFTLNNFRNYERQTLEFSDGVNVLIGANGQGKTNILEAIYYLSLLRSFRTTQIAALLNSGQGTFSLYGEVMDATGNLTRLGVSHGAERRLVVNGQNIRRASDFISRLICAPFLPEDISIIKGTPGNRRHFLDIALCQLSAVYLKTLIEFNDALKSRNAMLKTPGRYPKAVVTAYDQVMSQRAAFIEIQRHKFTAAMNEEVARQSKLFFPDGRTLAVNFVSGTGRLLENVLEDENALQEKYLKALDEAYERDCRDGATRYGPQRSDLACMLNGRQLATYGSEGECRTAAIVLKFALLEAFKKHHGASEITVLVDDVLGELDATRRKAFLEQVTSSGQVIFAGTSIPPEFPQNTCIFAIERGTATKQMT